MQLLLKRHKCILSGALVVLFMVLNAAALEGSVDGQIRTVMRGNALDIHFFNLTPFRVKIEPYFYSDETLPALSDRNLIFIPNTGERADGAYLPISTTLGAAGRITYDSKSKLAGRKFIQSIIVCNNISSYQKQGEDCENYSGGEYVPYSAFMWTNGVRSPDDGAFVFSNAMKEISNLKYGVTLDGYHSKSITFNLEFSAESHLDELASSGSKMAYMKKLSNVNDIADHIAALTSLAAGILSIPTNPAGGVLATVSGAAWEVQATAQTMLDNIIIDAGYKGEIKGYSWLSSPFDIMFKVTDCYIRNTENRIIGRGEFDNERGAILFYLGNDFSPSGILIQLSASKKGDLYINLLSSSLVSLDSGEKLSALSEFSSFNEEDNR